MRKKKHPEHENHERWLVSYADFITLLFAFFVVMFAVSQVDAQKMGRFVESVKVAFEFQGVFPSSSGSPMPSAGGGGGSAGTVGVSRPVVAPPKLRFTASKGSGSGGLSPRGETVKRSLEEFIKKSALSDRVRLRTDRRGVTVSLTEACFFDPGSAEVRPDSLTTLQAIAELVRETGTPVAVEGHTDSIPIRTALYPSNWELSTARATKILSYLIRDLGYDPTRLSASGYSEYRPIAGNDTAEGRAQNRRVDLVVLTEDSEGPPPR